MNWQSQPSPSIFGSAHLPLAFYDSNHIQADEHYAAYQMFVARGLVHKNAFRRDLDRRLVTLWLAKCTYAFFPTDFNKTTLGAAYARVAGFRVYVGIFAGLPSNWRAKLI